MKKLDIKLKEMKFKPDHGDNIILVYEVYIPTSKIKLNKFTNDARNKLMKQVLKDIKKSEV